MRLLITDAVFDTLAAMRQLKAKGFSSDQAEAITETVRAGVTGGVATKVDIAELRTELRWMKAIGGVIIALLIGLFWSAIDMRTTLVALGGG
ncbi:MAG: hypothetical protein OXD38_07050 [Aestuariivita sp.]|nr:hypothetical protein [Aestuariivita sp.]